MCHSEIVAECCPRARRSKTRWVTVVSLCMLSWAAGAMAVDDRVIEGYARAMLDRELGLPGVTATAANGVLALKTLPLGKVQADRLTHALRQIPGVTRVEVQETDASVTTGPAESDETARGSPWLPGGLLFEPLHADPRWAHFGLAFRRYLNGGELKNGAAANLGATIPLYRGRPSNGAQWEFGIQAGTFSLFDLSAKSGSNDILNTDFNLAVFFGYRRGDFSGLVRLMHQSSHLGDEFIQNTQTSRIEVNHDRLDLKLSYDLAQWVRVYGGGGLLLRQSPNGLGMGTVQAGVELSSPTTYWHGRLRPVAYADVQLHERTGWSYSHSAMAGVQFETARLDGRAIQLLIEHFVGPFPDGQFFTQKTQWIGIGLHLYY